MTTTGLHRTLILCALISPGWGLRAQESPNGIRIDAETISGLGARNIGSAAMSGRVAALDDVGDVLELDLDLLGAALVMVELDVDTSLLQIVAELVAERIRIVPGDRREITLLR